MLPLVELLPRILDDETGVGTLATVDNVGNFSNEGIETAVGIVATVDTVDTVGNLTNVGNKEIFGSEETVGTEIPEETPETCGIFDNKGPLTLGTDDTFETLAIVGVTSEFKAVAGVAEVATTLFTAFTAGRFCVATLDATGAALLEALEELAREIK